MRVVDTSAWIEWIVGGALCDRIAASLPEPADWVVPTIVQLELAKWITRELGEDEADRVLAFTMTCRVVPMDTTIALLAAELHRDHRLAVADSIVYATARRSGASVLTCDAHFEGLPNVDLIAKSSPRRPTRRRPPG